MNTNCIHSCKGLCNALEVAEHRELQAIREREASLKVLVETRVILAAKFEVLDNITDSFV